MKTSTYPVRLSLRCTRAVLMPSFVKDEHGSVMVETALSLAMWLTLVFGMMLAGLELYSFHYISEAARLGTRFAIVRGSSCTGSGLSGGCPATATNIQTYVKGLGYPGISATAMTVTSTWYNSPSSTTSCPTCNAPGDFVQVQVQYTFPFTFPFVPSMGQITSTSRMVIAQ